MFAELANSINNDISNLEIIIERAGIYMEYECELDRIMAAQDELNSITEAEKGLDHPEGLASDGIVGKAANTIKKLLASLASAIKAVFTKIRHTISDIKVQNAMKKAEKLAKENDKLKNKSVKITDPSKELKVIREHRSFLDKMTAKLRAGKVDQVSNSIDTESENYKKKLSAAKIAAVVTVSIAAAIAIVNKLSNSVSTKAEEALVKTADIKADLSGKSAEFVNALVKVEQELARAAKDEAAVISRAITDALSAIRDGVLNSREIETGATVAKDIVKNAMESTDDNVDIDYITNQIISEAEDNISKSTLCEAVALTNNDDFDPVRFLEIYEKNISCEAEEDKFDPEEFLRNYEETLTESDEDDINLEVEDFDHNGSISNYLVENAIN